MTDDAKKEREAVLLPCPFCGGEASADGVTRYTKGGADAKWDDGSEVREAFFVNCVKCGGNRRNVVGGQQTKELAIAAWNARQPTQSDALKIARDAAIEECALLVEGMGTSHDSHAGERFAKAIRALKESK